jgi:hypothetical protein
VGWERGQVTPAGPGCAPGYAPGGAPGGAAAIRGAGSRGPHPAAERDVA